MANLISGVLLKLFHEMGVEEKEQNDCRKPVLLQIRSIIPVLATGDDLWPNQGFFLKVSDSSHAMFVSLPQEQDDMVLCNRLQLGQFIYVESLEAAYPVPMLKGINPVPGRHPCVGDPKDLVATDNLERFCGASGQIKMILEECNEEKRKPRQASFVRSSSASKIRPKVPTGRRTLSFTRRRDGNKDNAYKNRTTDFDDRSDSETSTTALSSIPASRRRSWNGELMSRIGEVSDSVVVKHEIKPVGSSSCTSSVSSTRSSKYDSSDDNASSRPGRKDIGLATKLVKCPSPIRTPVSQKNSADSSDTSKKFGPPNDKKWTEAEISWDSLPSNLVKLGKEVLSQRDVALLAAVDVLQEASAAEKLLKCLSIYSELQASEQDDEHPAVDTFLNLQKDLAQARLIFQSLTNSSALRTSYIDPNDPGSIKEMLKLGFDRKKNATSWIKAALASDLTPLSSPTKTKRVASVATSGEKRSSKASHCGKTKGTYVIRMQRSNGEFQAGLAAEKDNQPDWVRGSALHTAVDLAKSLDNECRTWFLAYVEKYLDQFNSESMFKQSDCQVAEMMRQIKRVNDWLDLIVKREGEKDNSTLKDSELEAYGRVKNKIYGILLKHVERTALAFEHMNAIAEGRALDNDSFLQHKSNSSLAKQQ